MEKMVKPAASSSASSVSVIGNGDNSTKQLGLWGDEDQSSVRVALRIRPALPRELINGSKICTSVAPGDSQVWLGEHGFTYDYVFDTYSEQISVFERIRGLIDGCLDGFNATIIAYGQTGSGKTYTMGTGFDVENMDTGHDISPLQGIVPRAVHYLFDLMERRKTDAPLLKPSFKISIQFIELYNEEIIDLVDGQTNKKRIGGPPGSASQVKIHEDATGGIYLVGVSTKIVHSAEETMTCLRLGTLGRTTASTNMNDQSSRSHAIFTVHIEQTRVVTTDEDSGEPTTDFETLTAKFHFVDLAGSERLKRTGAVGERQKEGISINCGLLALGNVISALGDVSRKVTHVPYRDSKLTRLLQDSLGGNSRTIMIACVSPCDDNFVETLNTLNYANRARNIKNKVTINQDKSSRLINEMKKRIRDLEDELLEYKQGKRAIDPVTGEETESDTYMEAKLLTFEINTLKARNAALQNTVDVLTTKNTQLLAERTLSTLNVQGSEGTTEITELVQNYTHEIEQLSTKLIESEMDNESLKKKLDLMKSSSLNQSLSPRTHIVGSRPGTAANSSYSQINSSMSESKVTDLLESAKREVESQQDMLKRLKKSGSTSAKSSSKAKVERFSDIEIDEDDDEDEMDEEDETTTADEADEENESYSQLAVLTNDITTKQMLIEQLESTNRRMEVIKQNYEEKLCCLSKKISATEAERDKVLYSAQPAPKNNQIKADYEKKLNELQLDLKKWQQAARDHQKLLKQQAEKSKHIDQLKNDLDKMKQAKCKLMNQIKSDSVKFRTIQSERAKEIAQLKKEQRKKDNAIRSLMSEKTAKEGILKRKHEEINYLKNKMRATTVSTKFKNFSPVKAKKDWTTLQSKLVKSIKQKQHLESCETEMLQVIENRKKLNIDLEERRQALRMATSTDEKNKIIDDMDSIEKSLSYAEGKITELQGEMISNNDDAEGDAGFEPMVQRLNKEECSYVMKKMYEFCSENLASSKLYEKRVELLEKENQKIAGDLDIVKQLYKHLYSEVECNNNKDMFLPPDRLKQYGNSNGTSSQAVQQMETDISTSIQSKKAQKARRLTATPSELLGTSSSQYNFLAPAPPMVAKSDATFVNPNDTAVVVKRPGLRSQRHQPSSSAANNPSTSIPQPKYQRDVRRNTYTLSDETNIFGPPVTDEPMNGNDVGFNTTFIKGTGFTNEEEEEEMDQDTTFLNSPHASPLPTHRPMPSVAANTNNVFQRLTSQTTNSIEDNISRGIIKAVRPSSRGIIYNSHIAEGHSKAVLSIYASEQRLYSGGKDTTIKIWDLNTRQELNTIVGGVGSITAIKCSPDENLIYTSSSTVINVYDQRAGNKCVVKVGSYGLRVDESCPPAAASETTPIQALTVSRNILYSTFGCRVRAWDTRNFVATFLLRGIHTANVMCLASDELPNGKSMLVSGSKDHHMKVYELGLIETVSNTPVKISLEPPHYDGIQSLVMSNGILFSGSRDCCIKKWDLNRADNNFMVQPLNNAHGGWITGLAFAPSNDKFLLSVSRDGFMKLWSTENTCAEIDKFKVNKGVSIECIATNSNLIFTGSGDGTLGFCKIRSNTNTSSPENQQQPQFGED